jgi:hypothetical protein
MGQETQPPTESSKYDMDQPFKSIAVVALAGFAGSLAGLSISRSRPTTKNLPQIWSISCATFAGIIECSKIMSPTKLVIDALGGTDSNTLDVKDTFFQNIPWKCNASYTQILGDYTIGGMVAGAIFKGGQIESVLYTSQDRILSSKMKYDTTTTAHEQQKKVIGKGKIVTLAHKHRGGSNAESVLERNPSRFIRSSYTNQIPIPKAGIMTGLLPGMMLGIIAGSMQILITEAERLLEEHDAWNNDDHVEESYKLTKEQEDEIEEKVQKMSISEIEREIKDLKKQLGKE